VDATCVTVLQAIERKQARKQSTAGAGRPDIAKLEAECK